MKFLKSSWDGFTVEVNESGAAVCRPGKTGIVLGQERGSDGCVYFAVQINGEEDYLLFSHKEIDLKLGNSIELTEAEVEYLKELVERKDALALAFWWENLRHAFERLETFAAERCSDFLGYGVRESCQKAIETRRVTAL